MRMRNWVAIFGLTAGTVLAAGTVAARSQAQSQPQPAPAGQMGSMSKPVVPAGPLKITFGDKSAEWTPATLAALPHQTVTVVNSHTKASLTYSGVPLIDLLQRLGVPAKLEGKELRHYLVASSHGSFRTPTLCARWHWRISAGWPGDLSAIHRGKWFGLRWKAGLWMWRHRRVDHGWYRLSWNGPVLGWIRSFNVGNRRIRSTRPGSFYALLVDADYQADLRTGA